MLYHIFASVPTVFTEYCVQQFQQMNIGERIALTPAYLMRQRQKESFKPYQEGVASLTTGPEEDKQRLSDKEGLNMFQQG